MRRSLADALTSSVGSALADGIFCGIPKTGRGNGPTEATIHKCPAVAAVPKLGATGSLSASAGVKENARAGKLPVAPNGRLGLFAELRSLTFERNSAEQFQV